MLIYVVVALAPVFAAAPIQPLLQNGTSSAAATNTHTDKPHTNSPPHTTTKRPAKPAHSSQDKIIQELKEPPHLKAENKPKVSSKPKVSRKPKHTLLNRKKEAAVNAKLNAKDTKKSKHSLSKGARKANRRNRHRKGAPMIQPFLMSSEYLKDNDLNDGKMYKEFDENQGSRRTEGADIQVLVDFKDFSQKNNGDYREFRRAFRDQQSRRMQRRKMDPALAMLLPNSQQEDDERLRPQVGAKVGHRRIPLEGILKGRSVSRRPPQHLDFSDQDMRQPPPPPRPGPSEHQLPAPRENATVLESRNKKDKLAKLVKFIKKNKGLFDDLVTQKHARELVGENGLNVLREKLTSEDKGEPSVRATDDLTADQLDMVQATGSKISELRLKGRLCSRYVLNVEGPKYNSKGEIYQAAFDGAARNLKFGDTKPPKLLLPSCCNCCSKSVLGCE